MKRPEPVLTYYDIDRRVRAFSTTRCGGVSTGAYAAFNINAYCGDDPAHVASNRRALSDVLGLPLQHIVMPHQTHGCRVCRVDAPPAEVIEDTDALMTDVAGLCIGVSTADCIPIIIYDPAHHAAAAVHAGWRGTVQRIVQKAVEAMGMAYGSEPSQLKAVIGPGISLESFEVGDEVYAEFAAAGFPMEHVARRYPPMQGGSAAAEKWHIDLWACNRLQLEELGLQTACIQTVGVCTYAQVQQYFSARRLGVQSGRIFTAIVLS